MPQPKKKRKTAPSPPRRKAASRPKKPRVQRLKTPASPAHLPAIPPAVPAHASVSASIDSPWGTAWFHPRETVMNVLAGDSRQGRVPMAFVKGASQIFGSVSLYHMGNYLEAWAILLLAALLAFPTGYIGIYFQGWICEVVGGLLGGQAHGEQTRVAVTWCSIPEILAVPANVFLLLLFGSAVFTKPLPEADNPFVMGLSMVVFGLFLMGLALWSLILNLGAVAEVHRFSLWRAFWTNMIPGGVWLALVFLLKSAMPL